MTEGRQRHLIVKALVTFRTVAKRQPYFRRPDSDLADMDDVLNALDVSDVELELYVRSARWLLDGEVIPWGRAC